MIIRSIVTSFARPLLVSRNSNLFLQHIQPVIQIRLAKKNNKTTTTMSSQRSIRDFFKSQNPANNAQPVVVSTNSPKKRDISPTVNNVNDRPSKKSKVLNENHLLKAEKSVAEESKTTTTSNKKKKKKEEEKEEEKKKKKKTSITPEKEEESGRKKNGNKQQRSPVQSIVLTKSIVNGQPNSDDSVYEKDTEEEEEEEDALIEEVRRNPKRKSKAMKILESSDDEVEVETKKKTISPKVSPKKNVTKNNSKKVNKSKFVVSDEEEEEDLDDDHHEDEDCNDSSSPCSKQIDYIKKEEDFNPAMDKFNPWKHACWKQGENVPYFALAKTFKEIEDVSSRLKSTEIMANYFWAVISLSPTDLLPSIYLSLNRLAPAYEGIELGIGEDTIIKAIADATGRNRKQVKADAKEKGDLGLVAETSRSNQRTIFPPARLMLKNVFNKLKVIAETSSTTTKQERIQPLIVACKSWEARYLVRSLAGKLRTGMGEQTVLAALAQAMVLADRNRVKREGPAFEAQLKEAIGIIKSAYCQCPNYDRIVEVYLDKGYRALPEHCTLLPGVPLKPMLAHPTRGIDEILKRLGDKAYTCEFKYDGERAQIHYMKHDDRINIHVFSRNQENNTSKYPDVIARLTTVFDTQQVTSFILDAEAVAWDVKEKQILPFQILSTRKRKDAKEGEISVQVCIYAFDILYLNGQSLIELSFRERRRLMKEHFNEMPGEFVFAEFQDTQDTQQVQELLDLSLKKKCEGLMIKTLDDEATYEIAQRSHKWLKLKKDYLEGVGDSLDLVVIGAYRGQGKRTGAYGGFLLACYNDAQEEYQAICKLGTGFTDQDLESHYKFFQSHLVEDMKSYYQCDDNLKPDVWFEPVQVWEVKCADMSLSPVYSAAKGIVDENRGISLRFPRFVRVREDKDSEMATTAEQVAEMYESQEMMKKGDDQSAD